VKFEIAPRIKIGNIHDPAFAGSGTLIRQAAQFAYLRIRPPSKAFVFMSISHFLNIANRAS